MTMTRRQALAVAMAAGLEGAAARGADEPAGTGRKKVLVELFTSQGCNLCPDAEQLLGRLAREGVGPGRVVPVAFHVDYFNDPWKDPFSKNEFTRRQVAYSDIYNSATKRESLVFTPMLMVDGRVPMLGSNRKLAQESVARVLKEKPGVSIGLEFDGAKPGPGRRTLRLTVASRTPEPVGRELMAGVAVTEDPVKTEVPSGENAGKSLVEHFAARSFAWKTLKLARSGREVLEFPVEVESGWSSKNCAVVAFVQDWKSGRIYQSDVVGWDAPA